MYDVYDTREMTRCYGNTRPGSLTEGRVYKYIPKEEVFKRNLKDKKMLAR